MKKLTASDEPLPEERMEQAHRLVPPLDKEPRQQLIPSQTLVPAQRRRINGECRHRLIDLHQGQRLQGGQAHRQNVRHLRVGAEFLAFSRFRAATKFRLANKKSTDLHQIFLQTFLQKRIIPRELTEFPVAKMYFPINPEKLLTQTLCHLRIRQISANFILRCSQLFTKSAIFFHDFKFSDTVELNLRSPYLAKSGATSEAQIELQPKNLRQGLGQDLVAGRLGHNVPALDEIQR